MNFVRRHPDSRRRRRALTAAAERFDTVTALDAEAEPERQAEIASIQLDAWLFPDTAGGPLDTDHFRHRVWIPLPKIAKVQPRKIHNLRHTYASLMLQAGRETHFVAAS